VHPWLRGLDDTLRAAHGVINCWSLDPAVEMYVWPHLGQLGIHSGEATTPENWVYEWEMLAKLATSAQRRNDEAEASSEHTEMSALLDEYHVV
jgi:hypothetical protein